jgi:Leucine-rich repeat (LRR) protein
MKKSKDLITLNTSIVVMDGGKTKALCNQLTTIPSELGQLQSLTRLYLDYNYNLLTTIPSELLELELTNLTIIK